VRIAGKPCSDIPLYRIAYGPRLGVERSGSVRGRFLFVASSLFSGAFGRRIEVTAVDLPLITSTMEFLLLVAGLALLWLATLLSPPPVSLFLSCIASLAPVILFISMHAFTWVRRQFSRWRRRKPPTRQRRSSAPLSFMHLVKSALLRILQFWCILLVSAYTMHHLQNFLYGAIPSHTSPVEPLRQLHAFIPHSNVPLRTADSHVHHTFTRPSFTLHSNLHQGCYSHVTCTNNHVTTTNTLHAPAWSHDTALDGVYMLPANNPGWNASILLFTPIITFARTAPHQQAVSSGPSAAHCPAPVWWAHSLVPADCIPGLHMQHLLLLNTLSFLTPSQLPCGFLLNCTGLAASLQPPMQLLGSCSTTFWQHCAVGQSGFLQRLTARSD
jgi:hypothetical protein